MLPIFLLIFCRFALDKGQQILNNPSLNDKIHAVLFTT